MRARTPILTAIAFLSSACVSHLDRGEYDLIIENGVVYDGTGAPGRRVDVAIEDERIAAVGDLSRAVAEERIDAAGLAVTPGFVNVLSWANQPLLLDGRAQSDIRQGVTLEVMGEGWSMGPLTEPMRAELLARQSVITFDVPWTTLDEYLVHLTDGGVSVNVASFIGATTLRIHEIGFDDRPPTPEELEAMQELVREAMRDGALGVGSSLIYAPAFYADTEELIALVSAAAEYDGGYISHIRSEGDNYLEALEELIEIARATGARAQIYHLKPAGAENWDLSEPGLALLDAARAEGLDITANVYSYTAGATGLNAAMPPWVQEGGHDAWVARLRDPDIRARVLAEMRAPGADWESLYSLVEGPEDVILIGFANPELRHYTGRTLADVSAERGTSPEDTMIDLVIEDNSRVDTAYVLMTEENIERNMAWSHTMIGSDEGAYAPEGAFLEFNPHPRAYGTFARYLGHYVRERGVLPLEEAVHRLTGMPADELALTDRGRLAPGYFADVVIFDPETITDNATFAEPHVYATGVRDVFVNGEQVLRDGEHTGATPGQVVRGPGWEARPEG